MLVTNHGGPCRRFLLPFEAEPRAVGQLRCSVGLQLAMWGLGGVADAVVLAISELATNVIRHVGQGSAAALLVEANSERVRIEVHDTSGRIPHRESAGPEDETGRGLSLVAAVSGGWTSTATPAGKVVCCEFEVSDKGQSALYEQCVARGSDIVTDYVLTVAPRRALPLNHGAGVEAVTTDLITDLLHWLAANGRDPDTVLDHAQTRFEAEIGATGPEPRP